MKKEQTVKERTIVEEIHAEFDNAQDALLKEAKEIIKQNRVEDTTHVKKMHDLGFVNSKAVTDAKKKLDSALLSAENAKSIMHYTEAYPFLKFLTIDKLDSICEKYDLIHAPVKHYLMDVPKKNLEDIENAQKMVPGDTPEEIWRLEITTKTLWKKKDIAFAEAWRGDHRPFGMTFANMLPSKEISWSDIRSSCEFMTEDKEGLFIAAPKSHFNLKGLTQKSERGFFQTQREEVDDPIVFRYVRGGIQVLTKWGLEADDPALTNALDN
jgi:hypothetical protein